MFIVDRCGPIPLLGGMRRLLRAAFARSTPTTELIRKRVSHIVHLPEENQEAISILRYQPGQYYRQGRDCAC